MKHTGQPPTFQNRQPDWIAAALGTITVATLIAAAAVGTYVTIIGGQGNFASSADRTGWAAGIFSALMLTLTAYLFVVAAGMNTVFTTDEEQRHRRVQAAALGFYVQVAFVITFALLLTIAVFTHDSQAETAAGQTKATPYCQQCCAPKSLTPEDNHQRAHHQGRNLCR